MKYTLFLTQRCNLACAYCYVGKTPERMPLEVARRIIDFLIERTPPEEEISIGFFGGEPLLEFPLLQRITGIVHDHPGFDETRFHLSVVTNGTLLTPEMATWLHAHQVAVHISCDGPPVVHNAFRTYPNGEGSSAQVERGIRIALDTFGFVPVNAVYRPETVARLPETVQYFSDLGVRHIYLNPDFSAPWTKATTEAATEAYAAVAQLYMRFYRENRPHFISLIDGKITLLFRGGYAAKERCRMGEGELAFTPSGQVFPCERLASSDPESHAIGTANGLVHLQPVQRHMAEGSTCNAPCLSCKLRDYCMHWCGCSNFFMTGFYNRVGPFLCASEQASIGIAVDVIRTLEAELGPVFADHASGRPYARSLALTDAT